MLCGEAKHFIKEMSKLVYGGTGLGNIDAFCGVVRHADAAHIQFLGKLRHAVKIDAVGPATLIELRKNGFLHFLQFQQEIVGVDVGGILQFHRHGGGFHGQIPCENGVKKSGSLSTGDDLLRIGTTVAELKLSGNPQGVS